MTTSQKIGLISDTHGHLPKTVYTIFKNVDAIIHAGDAGSQSVLKALENLAPVTAVRGNSDTGLVAAFLEDVEYLNIAGHTIAVTHKFSQAQALMTKGFSGIIVFGHSHNPEKFNHEDVLLVNPGSPSQPRALDYGTVAILTLNEATPPEIAFLKVAFD